MKSQQLYTPHPALKPFVRYYWSLDLVFNACDALQLQVMADRFPRIVIQCLNGKNALHSAHYKNVFAASLKGVAARPAFVQMEPTYSHIAVSFFPHSLKALFGVDAHEALDDVFDLHHFLPAELITKIMEATHHRARLQLLETHLLRRLSQVQPVDLRVVNFLSLCPRTNYGRQLKDYGISERQFERKFIQSVGFTPSYYKRVLRFEKALLKIQSNPHTALAETAYELGYADQSHFNREFKQFSGMTPLAFIKTNELLIESGSVVAK